MFSEAIRILLNQLLLSVYLEHTRAVFYLSILIFTTYRFYLSLSSWVIRKKWTFRTCNCTVLLTAIGCNSVVVIRAGCQIFLSSMHTGELYLPSFLEP